VCTISWAQVEAPPIAHVSVNPYTSVISVAWNPSPSPNIAFVRVNYIYDQTSLIKAKKVKDMFRNQRDSIDFILDTMYIFPQDAPNMPLSFAVDAYSATGENSTNLHAYLTTMYLQAEANPCSQTIRLFGNDLFYPKSTVQLNVVEPEIIEVDENNNETKVYSIGDGYWSFDTHTFSHTLAPNGKDFRRFFIRMKYHTYMTVPETYEEATSNMVYVNFTSYNYPQFINLHSISATPENTVQLAFMVDTHTSFDRYILQRSQGDSVHFSTIDTLRVPASAISPLRISLANEFSLETVYYYRLAALDNCNTVVVYSPAVTPMRLSVSEESDMEHLLQWTASQVSTSQNTDFQIFRSHNNNPPEEIGTTNATSFIDNLAGNYRIGAHICYHIETSQIINSEQVTTLSNTACIEKQYRLVLPTAFNPRSVIEENRSFQPKYAFITGNYTLRIYDRYGSEIFTSHDINIGWDGTVRGSQLPAGVYQYKITVDMPTGTHIERLGSVSLVYAE
jgi:gliding motility-associated-like protein